MYCKHCGKEIVDYAEFCPHCGKPTQASNMNQEQMQNIEIIDQEEFGTGAKVWMIICIVANFFTALQYFMVVSTTSNNFVVSDTTIILLSLMSLASGISYLLLLLKKLKVAYFSIVGITVIALIVNISLGIGATAIFGLLNPLITYAAISKCWKTLK